MSNDVLMTGRDSSFCSLFVVSGQQLVGWRIWFRLDRAPEQNGAACRRDTFGIERYSGTFGSGSEHRKLYKADLIEIEDDLPKQQFPALCRREATQSIIT